MKAMFARSIGIVLAALSALLFAQKALALNNWELGKPLHAANCVGCHAPKFGSSLDAINDAIRDQAQMRSLSGLSQDDRSNISAYLIRPNFPVLGAPASVSMPLTRANEVSALTPITLSNSGDQALTTNSIALADDTHFLLSLPVGNCASVAASGGECTVNVRFRPQAQGDFSTNLTFNHNALGGSRSITLNGSTTREPVVQLMPDSALNFGAQTVGGLYPALTSRVTNAGLADLSITNVVVDGAAFAPDASAPTCRAATTLVPGAHCDIDVRFAPSTNGVDYAGTLRIESNAAAVQLPLAGTGSAAAVPKPEWSAALTELNFGDATIGAGSAFQSVTLYNPGPGGGIAPTVINAVGADGSMFVVTSDPADSLTCQVGRPLYQTRSCRIDLRFVPGALGARSAALQVVSNGTTPPTLFLSGQGVSGAAPALMLAPTTVALAQTRVGSDSAPVDVTIRSTGSSPLAVQGMTVSGPFRMVNKTCASAPFVLARSASCVVSVVFAPQSEGSTSGTLTIESNAIPQSQDVALQGVATARAEDGGGGCSMTSGLSPTDPTLWTLVLLAALALVARHRRRARHDNGAQR
jgi:hypothetical protein